MSTPKLNVLVYAGPGASPLSTSQALLTLRSLLSPSYAVSTITPAVLLREPWAPTCAALVFPGGGDLGYCRSLDGAGTRLIRDFVRRGGSYLGFCAGGYFGSARCEFEVGSDKKGMEVVGPRELAFFPGTCRGGAFAGFDYASEKGTRAARLRVAAGAGGGGGGGGGGDGSKEEAVVYCNGGGVFVDASSLRDRGIEVLAEYEDELDVDGGKAAIVHGRVGNGNAVLTGPHPEFDPHLLLNQPDLPDHAAVLAALKKGNASRLRLLGLCLARLGLAVADEPAPVPRPSSLHLSSLDHSEVGELLFELRRLVSKEGGRNGREEREVLRGEANSFALTCRAGGAEEPAEQKEEEAAVLENLENLDVSDGESEAPGPLELIAHESAWPADAETPKWNHRLYFESLRAYHLAERKRELIKDWGRVLLYGEVVTSTNTLLEKNPNILARLPTGTTFAAGAQVAGRGRGSNVWISPEGSLIFSTVINHPAHLATSRPIVFVQYVAAVAVVEAVHGYEHSGYGDLPVRLKWPNDIYARTPESTAAGAEPEWVKIGGILSNCAYADGMYQIVLGIGINTNNARPTTSLSALLPEGVAPFRAERLLASVMTRLGVLYDQFVRYGFARDLEERYYRYWLHGGQAVTVDGEVAATAGAGPVAGAGGSWRGRVLGVTRDWGMLKVEELEGPRGAEMGTGRVWALQSDENSFDFWRGLLRRKIELVA